MAQIHGDPDEIRGYMRRLHDFHRDTSDGIGRLRDHLEHLAAGSWSDSTHDEYMEMFKSMRQALDRIFSDIENEHETFLRELADRLEEIGG
jgi:hypothetical protein